MDFEQELKAQLGAIEAQGLYRRLRRIDSAQGRLVRMGGEALLNFSSNDYLGLACDPALAEAARGALETYGIGSGASRLLCGSLAPHHELEEELAQFKGTEAALVFSSGYAAALGTLGALLDRDDIVVLDKQVHACIIDAARLCGATLRVFAHNDLGNLERLLQWANARVRGCPKTASGARLPRILVVTESVFSMDGDRAPLGEMVALKERYKAWLMVDEAHATGLFGDRRRGLAEACGVGDRIEIQMGTLGKALGTAGGYLCGPCALKEVLINRARSFIFSTAPSPVVSAAGAAAVRWVQTAAGEARRGRLWELVERFRNGFTRALGPLPPVRSAIVPLIVGREEAAVELAERLRTAGFYLPAIRYPTVARGRARLRLTLTAAHQEEDVDRLLEALTQLKPSFLPPS